MESNMAHLIGKAATLCAVAGTLVLGTAASSLAQYVVIMPGSPYGYHGGAYGGLAYAPGYYGPGYGGYYYWNGPAGYDTSGAPYSYGSLGWQWSPPNGAPANPCTSGQRSFNRC
jgi:hypothetical protein